MSPAAALSSFTVSLRLSGKGGAGPLSESLKKESTVKLKRCHKWMQTQSCQHITFSSSEQPLLIDAVFPCRSPFLVPMLWPAMNYLIELFFHHERTLFFFHPSSCLKVKVGCNLNKPPVLPQRDKQSSTGLGYCCAYPYPQPPCYDATAQVLHHWTVLTAMGWSWRLGSFQ